MPQRKKSNLSYVTANARRLKAKRLKESASDRERRLHLIRTRTAARRALETVDEREARVCAARVRSARVRASRAQMAKARAAQDSWRRINERWRNIVRSGLSYKASMNCTDHAFCAMTELSIKRDSSPTTSVATEDHKASMFSMVQPSNEEHRTKEEEEYLEPIEFVPVCVIKEEPDEQNEEEEV